MKRVMKGYHSHAERLELSGAKRRMDFLHKTQNAMKLMKSKWIVSVRPIFGTKPPPMTCETKL